jgi:F-type H+-transporting ATPase subunit b
VIRARLGLIALFALLFAFAVFAQEHAPAAQTESGQPVAAKAEHAAEAENEGHLEAWKWANFLILAGVLGWMIAKNAPAFFRSRTEEIQRGITEAAKLKQDAEARAAKMEVRMASLQREIGHLRAESAAEIAKGAELIRQESEHHMVRVQAQGEQEIASVLKHAEKELKAYSAQLAVQLAGQRIEQRMSMNTQEALIDGFLRQLARKSASPEARI